MRFSNYPVDNLREYKYSKKITMHNLRWFYFQQFRRTIFFSATTCDDSSPRVWPAGAIRCCVETMGLLRRERWLPFYASSTAMSLVGTFQVCGSFSTHSRMKCLLNSHPHSVSRMLSEIPSIYLFRVLPIASIYSRYDFNLWKTNSRWIRNKAGHVKQNILGKTSPQLLLLNW